MSQEKFDKTATDFLLKLLSIPAPTGHEMESQAYWAQYMKDYADELDCDAYGSVWGVLYAQGQKENQAPTLMLDAHGDEIGFCIRYIDDKGFARLECVGGSDVAIAKGRRICFKGSKGDVIGVTGATAIHLRKGENKEVALKDIFVDFGCTSKDDVLEAGLKIGDVGVYCDGHIMLQNQRLMGRALDDRICGFIISQVAREIKERGIKPAWNIVFSNTVQEEIGCHGAKMLSYRLNPDAAICLDVTHAIDTPELDKNTFGDVRLGEGGVVSLGAVCHKNLTTRLFEVGGKAEVAVQRQVVGRAPGNNTATVFNSRQGIPACALGLPLRYMHTPVEIVDMGDVRACVELLIAFIGELKEEETFEHKLA